jgi:type 1 glutamine amidotransferase
MAVLFEEIGGWPYDVVVLYNFTQKISQRRRDNFLRLLDDGVGVLSLHHASGAFQEWCEYPRIIGCRYLLSPVESNGVQWEPSTYRHDVEIPVRVADTAHAITRGVRDFSVRDETYRGCRFEPDNHLLLTTTEQSSDEPLGWTRSYRRSRIVHFQIGHGPGIFADVQFRTLVNRAARWCAEGRRMQVQRDMAMRGDRQ